MSNGNILDLLNDLEQELKLEHVAEHILAIAVVEDVLMRDLFELAEREVGLVTSEIFRVALFFIWTIDFASTYKSGQNTLFRGNSV